MIGRAPFRYSILRQSPQDLFALYYCYSEHNCTRFQGANSGRADSRGFFEIENIYSSYPSAFAVITRSQARRTKFSISALLTEENFTHYERKWRSGQRKSFPQFFLFMAAATIMIVGIMIVWLSIVSKEEVVIRDDDPASRQSLLGHRFDDDGIPEIADETPASQYEYPSALS
jgi:hypothetical protein